MNLIKAKKTLGSAICLAYGIYSARKLCDYTSFQNMNEGINILKDHLTSNGLKFNWRTTKNEYLLSRICAICDYTVTNGLPIETAFRFFEHEFGISTLALEQ